MNLKFSYKPKRPLNLVSTLTISVMLFFLGIIFFVVVNSERLISSLKENVKTYIYLKEGVNEEDLVGIKKKLEASKFINNYIYVTKQQAYEKWINQGGDDFSQFLDLNILPSYFEVSIKSVYVNFRDLQLLKKDFESNKNVSDVLYPELVISKFKFINKMTYILIGVTIFLFIISSVLISSTIRLYIFNNRFLIRAMLLVGATPNYIATPYVNRSIFNGFFSSLLACVGIFIFVKILKNNLPDINAVFNEQELIILFGILIILGILMSYISTYRAVIKYLKKPISQLY